MAVLEVFVVQVLKAQFLSFCGGGISLEILIKRNLNFIFSFIGDVELFERWLGSIGGCGTGWSNLEISFLILYIVFTVCFWLVVFVFGVIYRFYFKLILYLDVILQFTHIDREIK